MGKEKRRNKKLYKIVFILIISLLTISIIGNVLIFIKTQEIGHQVTKLNKNYKKENNNLKNIQQEIKKYEEEIYELNNIDENTKKIKEELFDNIKTLEDKILTGKSDKKIVYITFDDGPYYSTYKVLNILKENNVWATFFIIGQSKSACYDNKSHNCYEVINEIAKNGHTIANHTYSHAIFKGLYSSKNNFIEQVKKQEDLIKGYTGLTTNIIRFPGGISTAGRLKSSITEELRTMNYGWIDWTASDGDGGSLTGKDQAWSNFKNSINSNIEVLLLHDYSNISISILPDIIKYLKDNNYLILPLSYKSNMVNK